MDAPEKTGRCRISGMQPRPYYRDKTLPWLIQAECDSGPTALALWARRNRTQVDRWIHDAGVLLFRGFGVTSAGAFREVCAAVSPDLRSYVGGDSPRQGVADRVYTSTEYPAQLEVLLHNELSYAGWSPDRVFFGCLEPAGSGGETQIADGREIYRRIDPRVRRRFEERGLTYLQYLWDGNGPPGTGKSWQQTFETTDRAAVARYLTDSGMEFEWTDRGIRTVARHPAVVRHAVTGEKCWHNQADQWHRGMASVKDAVPGAEAGVKSGGAGTEDFGNHVTFADGREIDTADLYHIREVSRRCEVLFPWQEGDLMVIDNVLAMHGRKPFTGSRKVLVCMA